VTEVSARLTAAWRRCLARSFVATWVAVSLAALVVALVLPGPLRALVTLPILFVAPGASLQLALGRRLREGDPWLALGLSVILSIALLPLTILVAYAIRRPLDAAEIVLAVLVMTGGLAAIGAARHPDARRAPAAAPARRRIPGRVIAAALVLVCGGVLVLVSWSVLPGSTPAPYSAIALSGRWTAVTRVTVVKPHDRLAVQVRVENHTRQTLRYRIVPVVTGASWKGGAVTLDPGRSWTGTVSGTMPPTPCLRRLSIALRCGPAQCNESLVLWLATRRSLPASCSSTRTGA
jgi:TRAP-type C4-dicarboxylate transport system permease small subunit